MNSTERKIKVLIADDHQSMLDGLRAFLSAESDIHVVAEANNGRQVIDQLHFEQGIDVAVIDLSMPEMDGLEAIRQMRESHPQVKVLVLSLHKDEGHIRKLNDMKVDGYVVKDRGIGVLVQAIRKLADGGEYFDEAFNKVLRDSARTRAEVTVIPLAPREEEMLKYMAQGLSSKEIGEEMHVSASTVETYKKNATKKLNLETARQLIVYAVQKYGDQKG